MKYKLVIAYDGTKYSGWQVQPKHLTVQELLQKTLKVLLRDDIAVTGSGRTDSGVHARGQVAHFTCDQDLEIFPFIGSVNGILPQDIRVLSIEKVNDDFHARYSAKGKTYHYYLCLNRFPDPFRRLYSYHIRRKLDLTLLKSAAEKFIGTHDFTSFANEAHAGSASRNPIRTLRELNVIEEGNGFVCLEFKGDGFLYKMVRNITGTLLEVAEGKRPVSGIRKTFEAKDRRLSGRAAPASALFMMSVDYNRG
jgi:tRNA pseudouridine38-40 synthase